MTTNMETPNVKMNKDNDEESELIMLQKMIEFHKISMENHEKLIGYYKDVVATRDKTFNIIFHFSSTLLLLLQNKYNNLSEAVLEIPYTSFDQYTTEKIKELEGELAIGKQTLDPFYSVDQDYMETIAKMFCKKDIPVNHKNDQNKNSKNQTIKQEEYESNMHIFVYKVILMQTEMKWWMEKVINLNLEIKDCQQYYENAQNKLKAMLIEKHETEIELLNLTTKVSKLRTLCIPCKKEKINLLLQLINDETSETKSLTAMTSKKSVLQKQMQQLTLNINSTPSNVQNTLKEQSEKQVPKESDKDNITLPSVTRRQEMMEEEDYNRITLLTTNTEKDDAMELLQQINNSLNKLLQNFKDKKIKSNKCSSTITILKDFIRKYENESTLLEEQIQALTKDFNKSDKADKTLEQVDENTLIEWLTESEEKLYQTLNEEIEITKLLENIEIDNELIVRQPNKKEIPDKDNKCQDRD